MEKENLNKVENKAFNNYKTSEPWPDDDVWHSYTHNILYNYVQKCLNKLGLTDKHVLLNAGCGKTIYDVGCTVIYMDIIEEYVSMFENYLVGSIEQIPLSDSSVDCVVCVGSVINYADIQKAILEFSRILKPNGILILEFERSNSAEFLFTKKYGKPAFIQSYHYNNQTHFLWMYNEKYVLNLTKYYGLTCKKKYRYHCISSLLYRLGMSEEKAARFSKFDDFTQSFSKPFSHNEIFILKKNAL